MTPDDLRGLTPLIYNHVNPYGLFLLNMNQHLLNKIAILSTQTCPGQQFIRSQVAPGVSFAYFTPIMSSVTSWMRSWSKQTRMT